MRYTRIGMASYLLGFALVGVALIFAAARSPRKGASEAAEQPAAATSFEWRELGAQTYDKECGSCHPDGGGRRGAPALRGLAVELFDSPGGRDYLVHLLLKGEVRTVQEGITTLEEAHPPFDDLSDAEAAALLNHMLTAWGNEPLLPKDASLYQPKDVAAQRR